MNAELGIIPHSRLQTRMPFERCSLVCVASPGSALPAWGLQHAWLPQCKASQANMCPAARSEGLLQGSACQSPAACRYKAPCRSLAGIAPKAYSKY